MIQVCDHGRSSTWNVHRAQTLVRTRYVGTRRRAYNSNKKHGTRRATFAVANSSVLARRGNILFDPARDLRAGRANRGVLMFNCPVCGYPMLKEPPYDDVHRVISHAAENPQQRSGVERLISELSGAGCMLEAATPTFVAIDVPPSVSRRAIEDQLQRSASAGLLDFDSGYLADGAQ